MKYNLKKIMKMKIAWTEAKSRKAISSRVVRRTIPYRVYKHIGDLPDVVYLEKGEYHADTKTIDIIRLLKKLK